MYAFLPRLFPLFSYNFPLSEKNLLEAVQIIGEDVREGMNEWMDGWMNEWMSEIFCFMMPDKQVYRLMS